MARGRRKTRTGNERKSTLEIAPELDLAILELQKRYMKSKRGKPTMRHLLIEGISLLLQREGLPAMIIPDAPPGPAIIEMPMKTGA